MADPIWISHIFLRSHLIGTAGCEIAVYIVCNKAGAVGSLGTGRQSVIGQIGDDEGDAIDVDVAADLAHNCGDGQELHSSAKLISLVIDLVENHGECDSLAGTSMQMSPASTSMLSVQPEAVKSTGSAHLPSQKLMPQSTVMVGEGKVAVPPSASS